MATRTYTAHANNIVPSDTATIPATSWIAFVNSGTQTLAIDTLGGEINVSIVLPSGMWPINAKRIYSTGTTVTDIVAFWGP